MQPFATGYLKRELFFLHGLFKQGAIKDNNKCHEPQSEAELAVFNAFSSQ
jgi:hypothetical protein